MFLHLSVSHSVQGGLFMMSLPVWLPGPMFLQKGLCPWSKFLPGGLCPGVSVGRPPQNHKSRQYASFRNAFLFIYFLVSHTLSAMQEQARLREFCVQNYLSTSTQVFRNVAFRVPRPPPPTKTWPD